MYDGQNPEYVTQSITSRYSKYLINNVMLSKLNVYFTTLF